MSLGEQIRKTRHAKGLTQVELAEKAEVSRPTVARLESGDDISTATLTKVGAALGLRVVLLHGECSDPRLNP